MKLIDASYDIPSTTTIDPYTGKTVTHEGSHVEARKIEIKIKNEPFTVQEGTANWTAYYQYNIRWKGHFEEEWHQLFYASDGYLGRDSGAETVFAPEGEYTEEGLKMDTRGMYTTLPPEAQIDFQVEAMIGYVHRVVESGWSNTQTLTISSNAIAVSSSPSPGSSAIASPNQPTATPTQPSAETRDLAGFDWEKVAIVVLSVFVGVLLVLVGVLFRKVSKKPS
ncbi:MAG: hypothetical protein M1540_03640 [Candidatus Bathyarchaeota archaeon]|nr:hypothetical protein [Candidatus Bathyarchaeota archaeon]